MCSKPIKQINTTLFITTDPKTQVGLNPAIFPACILWYKVGSKVVPPRESHDKRENTRRLRDSRFRYAFYKAHAGQTLFSERRLLQRPQR